MTEKYGHFIVESVGAPENLKWTESRKQDLQENEVRIRNEAIGVDFIDTQIRSGKLPAELPTGIGFAGVGIAVEVGGEVKEIKEGQRVAYMYFSPGSYGEERIVPADRVVALPDQELDPVEAAGALFRGLTAWYLATRLWEIKEGDVVLVHAAAGGVGLLLTQWLVHLGAIVVGTTTTAEKAQLLKEYGCQHPVIIPEEDFVSKVKEVSDGKGAAVVFESIGEETFAGSMDSVRRFGLLVSFGWASGDPSPISLMDLRAKGSLFITRPTVTQYTADADDLKKGVEALFNMIKEGHLKVKVGNSYPLSDAATAHSDLEAGRTVGSVVLVP